ncbi:zincin-like metallopeptidase toxin domain-containing protein [Paenibacillus dendritiformis]|uniref:Rhs core protein n=1 Tax=Paenibacillus dendritiformis C454 TaxID=1131935 RepID=H3SCN9_9BACL|nr:zincin-like metallopeptidase toxin domain-containing protein [Paenibacillus dendritiformis]EHQ63142.1 Rhs core protein [Paenibacillus dendritiformis C454]CAH8771914.1 hypothetical protein H7S4_004649 [Paenibacillus dendritiformis]
MSSKSPDEQKTLYQQKYVKPPAVEPEKKSEKEKQAELEKEQQAYDQMDRDRTAIYEWQQRSKQVMAQGVAAGKSQSEIQAMLPAPPVLGGQGSSHQGTSSGKPGPIERFVESTGIMDTLQQISPWLEQMELEYIIPQKPDYVSKQTQKTVYLSRYTFQVLIIDPQMLVAEFNILFGVVAIIAAIPTQGASLYLLAVADAALGASMIIVNMEKLSDLKNGNAYTNPKFLGMDQELLDQLGTALMVVNLSMLAKHGLYKAADKLANSKTRSAMGDSWAAWKKQVEHELGTARVKPLKGKGEAPQQTEGMGKPSLGDRVHDIDFMSWEGKPVSGQRKMTPGGQRYASVRDWKTLKKTMQARGINVSIDSKGKILIDPLTGERKAGGFNPYTGEIILKPDATLHEMIHETIHAEQWFKLGKENYLKQTVLEREEHVFNELMKPSYNLNEEEIFHAKKVIFKYRNGRSAFDGEIDF